MQFDFSSIEVDGSLNNPFALAAVVLWSIILSTATWVLVGRAWNPDTKAGGLASERKRECLFILALLFASTVFTQKIAGTFLYWLSPGVSAGTGIGFWGGPPLWPSWVVAISSAWIRVRRMTRRSL